MDDLALVVREARQSLEVRGIRGGPVGAASGRNRRRSERHCRVSRRSPVAAGGCFQGNRVSGVCGAVAIVQQRFEPLDLGEGGFLGLTLGLLRLQGGFPGLALGLARLQGGFLGLALDLLRLQGGLSLGRACRPFVVEFALDRALLAQEVLPGLIDVIGAFFVGEGFQGRHGLPHFRGLHPVGKVIGVQVFAVFKELEPSLFFGFDVLGGEFVQF